MEASKPTISTVSRVSNTINHVPVKLANSRLMRLFTTPEVLGLQADILKQVADGIPIDTHSLWDRWGIAVDSSEEGTKAAREGENALSLQLTKDEETMQALLRPDSSLAILGQVHEVGYVMKHPSFASLNAISTVVALTKTHNHAYRDLIRMIKPLGSGTYGRVVASTLRDPLTDLRILNILRQMSIIDGSRFFSTGQDNPLLTELLEYVEALPNVLAIKESSVEENLIREYAVGREVWSALAKYGMTFVPAMYSTINCGGRFASTAPSNPKDMKSARVIIEDATLRGVCAGYNVRTLLMQYASGQTLFNTSIASDDMDVALLYIHATLAYLYKQIGFVHGDLSVNNVMLEGLNEGRSYSLPILSEDGKLMFRVTLPFNPILIDLGASSTTKISGADVLTSPLSDQFTDVFTLYSQLNRYKRSSGNSVAIEYVSDILSPVVVGWNSRENYDYLPRVGVSINGLTHKEIATYIAGSMYIKRYMLDIPATPRRDILAHSYSSSDYRLVAETAKSVQELYREKRMESDPDDLVKNYLQETVEFYSPRVGTPKLIREGPIREGPIRERPAERMASIPSPVPYVSAAAPSISTAAPSVSTATSSNFRTPLLSSGKLPVFPSPDSEYAARLPQRSNRGAYIIPQNR